MSKVAIKGNASGTGTFTLEAPNSNTDRTLVLPDEAGTVLTSASSIPASSVTGLTQGITDADQWRITSTSTYSNGNVISANWERNDQQFSLIGSGMTQSSGVFTFPSTGIYLVISTQVSFVISGGSDYLGHAIEVSTDGGSGWSTRSLGYSDARGTNAYQDVTNNMILDVTSISLVKVRMVAALQVSAGFEGNTNSQRTGFTFIRLGDT